MVLAGETVETNVSTSFSLSIVVVEYGTTFVFGITPTSINWRENVHEYNSVSCAALDNPKKFPETGSQAIETISNGTGTLTFPDPWITLAYMLLSVSSHISWRGG